MVPPIFEITPTHVLSFGIKLSEADAREWLNLRVHTFSLKMKDIIPPELSRLFNSTTLPDQSGRAFNRFFKKVDKAIRIAEHEYAEKIGLCYSGDSMTERDRCRMVAYLMGARSGKRGAICYQQIAMTSPGTPREGPGTREVRQVHVMAEAGKVRARVLAGTEQLQKKTLVFGAPDKKSQQTHPKVPATSASATVH